MINNFKNMSQKFETRKSYSPEEEIKLKENIVKYFNGDQLACDVWFSKYRIGDEIHPVQMFIRCAETLALKEQEIFKDKISDISNLSEYGKQLFGNLKDKNISYERYNYYMEAFDHFKYIIPGGSMLSGIGVPNMYQSLSNCLVLGQPSDSYAGIIYKEHEMVQTLKRRCGVGVDMSLLRPENAVVHNQSNVSTGLITFVERYSNAVKEVAQRGRRGAAMISLRVKHPDILSFIRIKRDLTKITGANISIIVNDEFMKAVENSEDYICVFPVSHVLTEEEKTQAQKFEYGVLGTLHSEEGDILVKRYKASELFEEFVYSNWKCAEPGLLFENNIENYGTDTCYDEYRFVTTNPCFAAGTKVLTKEGYKNIEDLVGEKVSVWNGEEWSEVSPKITGENQPMLRVTLSDGTVFENTDYHGYLIIEDENISKIEAKDLKIGDEIIPFELPKIKDIKTVVDEINKMFRGFSIDKEGNIFNFYEEKKETLHEAKLLLTECGIKSYIFNHSNNELKLGIKAEDVAELEENGICINYLDANIIQLPDKLMVEKIERIENADKVYCFTEPKLHRAIFNGVLVGQCGEQVLAPYDCCRLAASNLYSFVENKFTKDAYIDYKKLYEIFYNQIIFLDTIVSLEIDYINEIIHKIETTSDNEQLMNLEKNVWEKIKDICIKGRRCGSGIMGLSDMLASMNLPYDAENEKTKSVVEKVMKTKMEAEMDASIDLSILLGSFYGFSAETERTTNYNKLFNFIKENMPVHWERMQKYGRRNVSWSTVAPTGSTGIEAQVTGGIEPLFIPFYKRRKKCMNENDRVDYVDIDGEKFTEYMVLHRPFMKYCEETFGVKDFTKYNEKYLNTMFEESPYFNNCASDVNYYSRVKMQSLLQKYTTSSISSTINLPSSTTRETINQIYREAWKQGLKGITVYREGSRGGVIVKNDNSGNESFEETKAPKRPQKLKADIHMTEYRKQSYFVIIGLYNDKPYECFVCPVTNKKLVSDISFPTTGNVIKKAKNHYLFEFDNSNVVYDNIQSVDNEDIAAFGLMVSTMLRHRIPLKFVCKSIDKANILVTSFQNKILHVLNKYLPDEVINEVCPECHSKLRRENGCIICPNCGYSKC